MAIRIQELQGRGPAFLVGGSRLGCRDNLRDQLCGLGGGLESVAFDGGGIEEERGYEAARLGLGWGCRA